MEDLPFWNKFASRDYGSYFFIFFANVICWIGSLLVLSLFTNPLPLPLQSLFPKPETFYILIFTISAIIFSLIGGKLVDRSYNRRPFIIIGLLLYIPGFLLPFSTQFLSYTLIDGTVDLILSSIILGMAFGMSTVPIGAYFADVSSPKERGKLQGLSYCISFAFAFFMIYLFQSIIIVLPIFAIIGVSLIIFNILYKTPSSSEGYSKNIEQSSYRAIFRHKNYIYLVISFLLFMIALPFIQVFLREENVLIPLEFINTSNLIYFPLLSGFALLGGFWADRGRRSMILISFLILGLGFTIWGILGSWDVASLIIIWILVSVGNAITNIIDYIIPADHAAPNSRGKYIAVFFIATNFGLLISNFLQPFIVDLPLATIALIITTLLLFAITPTILTREPLEEALAMEVDVKGVYVISQDGRCMVEMSFKDVLIDVDLITSALSAVGSLIKESVHSEKKLKSIDHEDVKILVEYGTYVNSAIIADKETMDVRDRLGQFLSVFEKNYHEYVSHWTGDLRPFFEAYQLIERYFGVYLTKK